MTAPSPGAAVRLVVSTTCPNCGAALDFSEGTNALQCDHCRSNLLVTGRRQVLSYFVSPKLDGREAVSAARVAEPPAGGPFGAGNPRLFFLPYYRLTGWDLSWRKPAPERRDPVLDPFGLDPDRPDARVAALLAKFPDAETDDIEFHEHYIERNFLALDLPGIGLYSLGMRPSALRLELYRPEALETLGQVVNVDMTPEAALAIGQKTGDPFRTAYRGIIGAVLSIVYFPFWLVEIRRAGESSTTILDGVSRAVVARRARLDLGERLSAPQTGEPVVIGFRPLVCPNCGWNLPVTADAVIFHCGSCATAWKIAGAELLATPYQLAALPDRSTTDAVELLPFWALRAEIAAASERRWLIPAFRHRRMKSLVDLAVSLAELDPKLEPAAECPHEIRGCHFDEADAAALALFVHAGSSGSYARAEKARGDSIRATEQSLIWIPFLRDAYSLRDPFHGTSIARNLLG